MMRTVFLAGVLAAAGCSSGPVLVDVAGTVTLDGAPLADGDIIVEAADATTTPASGIIRDGAFALKMSPGQKKVRIFASRPTGRIIMDAPEREPILPETYNARTILTADVPPSGAKTLRFDLKSKP